MSARLKLSHTGQLQRQDPLNKLNVALKATGLASVVYFSVLVPYHVLLAEDGSAKSVTMVHDLITADLAAYDHFGAALCGVGDVDGDGVRDLVVGA